MRFTDDELLRLGIRHVQAPGRGFDKTDAYIYKCPTCGRPVQKLTVIYDRPVYCNLCKTDAMKKKKAAMVAAQKREVEINSISLADADKKIRFQKAASIMQKFTGYDQAIEKAELAYEKYGSVPEAVAAIVLLHAGYRVIAQQPVSDYRLDFVLQDEKFVIEIDGAIYHADEAKRELRDSSIRYNLGSDWDVIHIPADALMKTPKEFERLIKMRTRNKP